MDGVGLLKAVVLSGCCGFVVLLAILACVVLLAYRVGRSDRER